MAAQTIKGAVFDMDGLMIDTEKLYLRFWKESARDFGYDMKDEHVFAIRSMARKYSIPKLKSFFGEDFPTEEVRAHRTELMNRYIEENGFDVKKGLFELLDYLKATGRKMAVATATPQERTKKYLSMIGADGYFSAMICGIRSAYSAGCKAIMIPDMTQPESDIMPMLSAVYTSLDEAIAFFEGSGR